MNCFNEVISYNIVLGHYEGLSIVKNESGSLFYIEDKNHILEVGELVEFEGLISIETLPEAKKNMIIKKYEGI